MMMILKKHVANVCAAGPGLNSCNFLPVSVRKSPCVVSLKCQDVIQSMLGGGLTIRQTQVIFSYLSGSVFPCFAQFPMFCCKIPGETASKWRYFCTFPSLHDLFPSCGRTLVRSGHSKRHVTLTFGRWIPLLRYVWQTDVSKL